MQTIHRWLFSISACLLLASCTPLIDTRGHSLEESDFTQIIPGQTSEDDVRALLGSPSTSSDFGSKTWYYIAERKETIGAYAPEVAAQHVVAIHFDADGHVSTIDHYDGKDGKNVQFVQKETPTEGHSLTFMEQMMGNFGRFSAPGSPITPGGVNN